MFGDNDSMRRRPSAGLPNLGPQFGAPMQRGAVAGVGMPPPIQQQPQPQSQSQGMDPTALMMLMRMLQQGRGQQGQPVGVMNQWTPVSAPLGGAAAGLGGGAGGAAFPAGMLSSFGGQVPPALSGLDFSGMGGAPAMFI
jgi:hypothetical protein